MARTREIFGGNDTAAAGDRDERIDHSRGQGLGGTREYRTFVGDMLFPQPSVVHCFWLFMYVVCC